MAITLESVVLITDPSQAVRVTAENLPEVLDWLHTTFYDTRLTHTRRALQISEYEIREDQIVFLAGYPSMGYFPVGSVRPGEWIVIGSDGRLLTYTDLQFRATYAPTPK